MSAPNLINLSVEILVSDPWDFGTECGVGPFSGIIINATAEKLVIRLSKPISYSGKTLHTAAASPRHVGDSPEAVTTKRLSANFMLLPQKIDSVSQLQPEVTKDGVAVVGTVEHRVQLDPSRERS